MALSDLIKNRLNTIMGAYKGGNDDDNDYGGSKKKKGGKKKKVGKEKDIMLTEAQAIKLFKMVCKEKKNKAPQDISHKKRNQGPIKNKKEKIVKEPINEPEYYGDNYDMEGSGKYKNNNEPKDYKYVDGPHYDFMGSGYQTKPMMPKLEYKTQNRQGLRMGGRYLQPISDKFDNKDPFGFRNYGIEEDMLNAGRHQMPRIGGSYTNAPQLMGNYLGGMCEDPRNLNTYTPLGDGFMHEPYNYMKMKNPNRVMGGRRGAMNSPWVEYVNGIKDQYNVSYKEALNMASQRNPNKMGGNVNMFGAGVNPEKHAFILRIVARYNISYKDAEVLLKSLNNQVEIEEINKLSREKGISLGEASREVKKLKRIYTDKDLDQIVNYLDRLN